MNALVNLVGSTDIYLLDQILKNRFHSDMKILDAGCGSGRNLYYFLKQDFEVYGVDVSDTAINQTLLLKNELQPALPDANFRVANLDKMPYEDAAFDYIICSAVLHFSKDEAHFNEMVNEMWRILKPSGILFCRLASSIGIENRIQALKDRHFLLPDGTKRFLVSESMLLRKTHQLDALFAEPIKTVNVQNSRCMTTWVLQKRTMDEKYSALIQ